MAKILARGLLTFLEVNTASSLYEISIDVVEAQPDSKYFALSHVWADVLGNPNANALPRFQVWHISNLAAAIRANMGQLKLMGKV